MNRIKPNCLFDTSLGAIDPETFDTWHETAVCEMLARESRLNVGWATKIINVYLKVRVYIGGQGRPSLDRGIHPPIDAGLWAGLRRHFSNERAILAQTHCVQRIKDINDYECYRRIVDGCRAAATMLDCKLIEVEQFWAGTEFSGMSKR